MNAKAGTHLVQFLKYYIKSKLSTIPSQITIPAYNKLMSPVFYSAADPVSAWGISTLVNPVLLPE